MPHQFSEFAGGRMAAMQHRRTRPDRMQMPEMPS